LMAGGLFWAALSIAQGPAFEVASVKPAQLGATERSLTHNMAGKLTASNATLKMLLMLAYQVMPYQVSGGPNWLDGDGFDIDAKAPPDPKETPAQFRGMLQSLLADRFGLKVHREMRTLPVYLLVVARNGPKLLEANGGEPEAGARIGGPGRMTGVRATMSMLATALTKPLQSKVIDETGLTGAYNFTLEFTPEQNPAKPGADAVPADDGPSLFAALQQQLGLELKTGNGPVEVLVVDRAEKPTAN